MRSGVAAKQDIGGYVLAGGRSSRMGRDKALLELAGHPLIAHAVAKLRRVAIDVHILAGAAPGHPALAAFAPLVFDRHPGCGPAAGIEAALAHSVHDWNLILPVDLPFLPGALLDWWTKNVTAKKDAAPVALFRLDCLPQPTLLLLRREVRPYLAAALARGDYKLYPILKEAARQLTPGGAGMPDELDIGEGSTPQPLDDLPRKVFQTRALWFANLNTPAEFAAAEEHCEALDMLP